MARTAATQRRSTKSARRSTTPSKNGAGGTKRAAGNARKKAEAMKPSATTRLASAAAKKALKAVVRRTAEAGATAVRAVTDRTTDMSRDALETALSKRLPIQVGIDVAVPLGFAWDEWMTFEWMTEGVHRIIDVERDGDQLFGELSGPRSTEWVADIVDEREEQSFAWRSLEGSDCAGLVTFHRLSERLTRIELDLDVLPTNPAEAASLALRIGRRHAESELRRFKAHVEFINPDVYESADGDEPADDRDESNHGDEPEDEDDQYKDDDQ